MRNGRNSDKDKWWRLKQKEKVGTKTKNGRKTIAVILNHNNIIEEN